MQEKQGFGRLYDISVSVFFTKDETACDTGHSLVLNYHRFLFLAQNLLLITWITTITGAINEKTGSFHDRSADGTFSHS